MDFVAKKFSELSLVELYEIIKSRSEVFLLEQNIICQDLDDVDYNSLHCFFFDSNLKRVTAYLRAFYIEKDVVSIGRVLTLEHRKGLGTKLMLRSFEEIKKQFNCKKITLHAQKQAVAFYEKLGFNIVSDEFLEEGIVHVTMEKRLVFDE
ncbi:MAG: GNAT family N-acetyltransferase [Ruminococcaceae bacterium]|nr:GNAT family N-acetyltransferase [Oscillospiraceae bacterium]